MTVRRRRRPRRPCGSARHPSRRRARAAPSRSPPSRARARTGDRGRRREGSAHDHPCSVTLRSIDQLVAGRARVLEQRRIVVELRQREQREDRPGAAHDHVRAALGAAWRLRLGGDPATARPQLVIVEQPGGMRGRPRDPQDTGVEAVAPARRQRRRARDRLPERTAGRAADGPVAVHDGELREEQADARGPVVEVRLERAVLDAATAAPGRPPRRSSCSGRRARPRRPRCDRRSMTPRRGTRRQRTCRPASVGSR